MKNKSKNKLSSQNAITLIALIVTIIVLLILASISISLVIGENGIIKKARESKNEYTQYAENDQAEIDELYNILTSKKDNTVVENKIEDEGNTEVKIGKYQVDNLKYYDTLLEAINNAQDGSTIKVMENTEEEQSITFNKSFTLDTNGKTITYKDTNNIAIEEGKNIIINGNGTLKGETNRRFIHHK